MDHKVFDPAKDEQREDYFYSLVLLFVPFRDEMSLVKEKESAEEAFQRLLPRNNKCSSYHKKLQMMVEASSTFKAINEARKADSNLELPENKEDDDGPQLDGEAKSAMQDANDIDSKALDTKLTLEDRINMLNADQRRVFDRIKKHLTHQQQHEMKQCGCCDLESLKLFVSGVGGTGKSFLIMAVLALVGSLWPQESFT